MRINIPISLNGLSEKMDLINKAVQLFNEAERLLIEACSIDLELKLEDFEPLKEEPASPPSGDLREVIRY